MIAIADYGVGNVRSVERALQAVGADPKLTRDFDDLERASGIVLPGVGAFAAALEKLQAGNFGRGLVELARRGKPLLGVCVGYQLLFEESLEHGRHEGLGLLRGKVDRVKDTEKIPVIGWCRLRQLGPSPLWDGIDDRSYFYFVHSWAPDSSPDATGATDHATAAAAERGRVLGTQFHPEKSGRLGLRVYANFLNVCGAG